jgi:alpha-L-fucosidase 2
MSWKDGKIISYRISSVKPSKLKVRVNGIITTIVSKKQ